MPTMAYDVPGFFQSITPTAVTFIKSVFDLDIWKDLGAAMKIRREFAEKSSLFAQEYCRVATTETVIIQAFDWANSPVSIDTKYEPVKQRWLSRLSIQKDLITAGQHKYLQLAASELIYLVLNDKAATLNVDVTTKQKLALCLNYAIWRETEDIRDHAFNLSEATLYFEQEDTIPKKFDVFHRYVESGNITFPDKLSPWFAFDWIMTKHSSILENIHDSGLKQIIDEIYTTPKKSEKMNIRVLLMNTAKRAQENAFLLNVLSMELLQDPDKYEKEVSNPDTLLTILTYNVLGVRYWGECLDRTYLIEKTVNSFIGKTIISTKHQVHTVLVETLGEGLVKTPQVYAMNKLHIIERDLIRVGVSQISESLQNEFKILFSTKHIAEGAIPMALTIFIHAEMMRMGTHFTPTQIRPMVHTILQGLFPLVLAFNAKITGGIIQAYERHKQSTISPQLE
jgi:hypothetical protein